MKVDVPLNKETNINQYNLYINKVSDRNRGQPEGSFFICYDTEVTGRALLLDYFSLLLTRTL